MLLAGCTGFIAVETVAASSFELQWEGGWKGGGGRGGEEGRWAELPAQFKWESGPRGTCTCMHVRDR